MGPLLEIRTVPFSFEMKINHAKFETKMSKPSHEVTRQKGELKIDNTPARINIDTTEARASLGLKSVARAVDEFAQIGVSTANEATAQFAREGNMLMDSRNKNAISDIAFMRSQNSIDTMLGFLPSTSANVSFDPHQLSMQYEMDKLSFDWRTSNNIETNFVPASIEFKVKDYARLEITYLGKPIYVPPSADPDYVAPKPLDIKA